MSIIEKHIISKSNSKKLQVSRLVFFGLKQINLFLSSDKKYYFVFSQFYQNVMLKNV